MPKKNSQVSEYIIFTFFILIFLSKSSFADTQTDSSSIGHLHDAQGIISEIDKTNNPSVIKSRMKLLSQLIADGRMTLDESAKIVRDTPQFYNALIEARSRADSLDNNAIDDNLKTISLRWAILLNDLHGKPDRFQSIGKSDSRQLYTLLVYTKNDIYASSFMGVFRRLLQQMKQEGISGDQLLRSVGYNRSNTFIEILVTYNRLGVFLATMDPAFQTRLLADYINRMNDDPDRIGRAAVIADAFRMIRDTKLLQSMLDSINAGYARCDAAGDKEGRTVFGLLAGIYSRHASLSPDKPAIDVSQYRLLDNLSISAKELFGQGVVCVQQYFFYDDEDGNSSFNYFLSQYQNKPGWTVIDKQTFVIVRSPTTNGRRIDIYANKSGHRKDGCEQIRHFLSGKNIHAVVAVHRGHSYQAFETLRDLPPYIRIMFWGSCEGYRESIKTYKKGSKLVALIATRGITYSYINELILQKLNDELLNFKTGYFSLNNFWQRVRKDPKLRNESNFADFVSPVEGYGVRLRRTLESLGI